MSTRTHAALILILMATLAGCGSTGSSIASEAAIATEAATPRPTPDPTATPTPTQEPTPTPEPTPDPAAWGELYLTASQLFVETTCPYSALINAAPDDPVAWQEAMTGIGAAWQVMQDELSAAAAPEIIAADVAKLLENGEGILAASEAIAGAPPDIDIIISIFESEYAPARDAIGAAGDAIRAALELPPRDVTACE